ncbi:MAG: hypothetical protein EOM20_08920 [Spartobacteria bacterium]|nr:hypothetical protein [Spartobacteria bacterium]
MRVLCFAGLLLDGDDEVPIFLKASSECVARVAVFPTIGSFSGDFFQPLEKISASFPMIGKLFEDDFLYVCGCVVKKLHFVFKAFN